MEGQANPMPHLGNGVTMYVKNSGYYGLGVALENLSNKDVRCTCEVVAPSNLISHRQTMSFTSNVPAGECEILHFLMPEDVYEGWGMETIRVSRA